MAAARPKGSLSPRRRSWGVVGHYGSWCWPSAARSCGELGRFCGDEAGGCRSVGWRGLDEKRASPLPERPLILVAAASDDRGRLRSCSA